MPVYRPAMLCNREVATAAACSRGPLKAAAALDKSLAEPTSNVGCGSLVSTVLPFGPVPASAKGLVASGVELRLSCDNGREYPIQPRAVAVDGDLGRPEALNSRLVVEAARGYRCCHCVARWVFWPVTARARAATQAM